MSTQSTAEAILSAQNITKSYGSQPILKDLSLTIHAGERVGLIGRNGTGKSTLMRILAGLDKPDEGKITNKQGLRVGMLSQECQLDLSLSVADILNNACAFTKGLLTRHEELTQALFGEELDPKQHDTLQHEYDDLHHTLEVHDAWNLQQTIDKIAQALGVPPYDRILSTLSGGELRRVDLAATLIAHPDVLLLDEPTNHIDTASVEWIEKFLSGYTGTCLIITHDRYFLDLVVNRIVEIEFNELYSFPGNYHEFLEYKSQIQEIAERTENSRQNVLRRELAWLRRGAKARSTKQKARIDRYYDLEDQGGPNQHKEFGFEIPEPPRLGKRVLDVKNLSFKYPDDDRTLFKDFNMIMQKGMRIGIVGPNGSGKTTMLRCLLGQDDRYRGTIYIGENTEYLYIDQMHSDIDLDKSILDFVSGGSNHIDVNGRRVFIPGYLEAFLFDMDSLHSPLRNLSGGERNRIELAKKLLQGGNFLVLDEPTNDLDLPTLRVLEEAILHFDGCALIVSHDRYFLNRLCTHMIVFEEDGGLYFNDGNYDDYLIYKKNTEDDEPIPTAKKSTAPQSTPSPTVTKKKLSYKEQIELEGMEKKIEKQENTVSDLEGKMAEAGFYDQDYTIVQETISALETANATLMTLYARWEELEKLSSKLH